MPLLRPMPAKYLQSCGIMSSGMRSLRSLVLKTQWIRMLGYLWATDQIFTVHERMSVLDVTRRVFMITVPKARHVEAAGTGVPGKQDKTPSPFRDGTSGHQHEPSVYAMKSCVVACVSARNIRMAFGHACRPFGTQVVDPRPGTSVPGFHIRAFGTGPESAALWLRASQRIWRVPTHLAERIRIRKSSVRTKGNATKIIHRCLTTRRATYLASADTSVRGSNGAKGDVEMSRFSRATAQMSCWLQPASDAIFQARRVMPHLLSGLGCHGQWNPNEGRCCILT